MKRVLSIIFLTTCFYAMGQEPKTLFHHRGFLLSQEGDETVYVKDLRIREPTNNLYYAQMDSLEFSKVAFTMKFELRCESKSSIEEIAVVTQFAKESAHYKIFEWSYLNNWFDKMDDGLSVVEMSFQANVPEGYTFVGYSDNETLIEAKVWKYLNEHFAGELRNLNTMQKNEVVLKASAEAEKFSMDPPLQEDFSLYFYSESDIVFQKNTLKEYTGSIKIIYPTGEDYAVWNYIDGKLEGEQLLFNQSGGKLALFRFKDNKAEGEQYNYYEDGKTPLSMYTFKNGQIDGHTIHYYRNGNKEKEGYSRGQSIFEEKLTGHWIYYWENGNKRAEGTLSFAGDFEVRKGEWVFYDEGGKVIETKDYTGERYIHREPHLQD